MQQSRSLKGRFPFSPIAVFTLIGFSLLFSNPPGASPDEEAHYLKAIAVGRGEFVLERPLGPPPAGLSRQLTWMREQSGRVTVPKKFSPIPWDCYGRVGFVGTCEQGVAETEEPVLLETHVASYPPFAYVLPGLFMRVARDQGDAMLLGRLGSLLPSLVLLSVAVCALHERSNTRWLAGVICSVAPVVLWAAASLSGSGLEIASAICFLGCLLRITRSNPPKWVWWAAGGSGATLALARDLGPYWVAFHLGLLVLFSGFPKLRSRWARAGKSAWISIAILLVGLIGAMIWQANEGVRPELSSLRFPLITPGIVGGIVRQFVGVFGPLDTLLPEFAYRIWAVMAALLVLLAAVSGTPRQRATLGIAGLGVIVITIGLEAVQNINGFGVQGRHVMPAVVTVPMLAGEIFARGPRPYWASSRVILAALALGASVVHFTAWYTLGRRYSVGLAGPLLFFREARWAPPLGWIVWGLLTIVAALVLMVPFFKNPQKKLGHSLVSGSPPAGPGASAEG